MRVGIIVSFLAALAGCGARTVENTPAEDIAWAEQRIEGQHAIKRQLVRADPIERKIRRTFARIRASRQRGSRLR